DGPCETLHGHNWKVVAAVKAQELDHLGMVVDFKVLKQALKSIIERMDHTYLNEVPPFDRLNPTSEHIARFIFYELGKVINDDRKRVSEIRVWESEGSLARYCEED
ncbi:MAG TPA: 6-carboxytetrahydropterin synthase, partial [Thermodesulfobacteriota bacterium]|nr:6-carboxytetrahydropterin synthase [Thermodesulfobacteriota bacterium]